MAEQSLRALIRVKKYRSWKGDVGKAAPNILKRNFIAQKFNEKWVTDVTEFAVNGEKLYLSPILDLFNGEVVSHSMSERPLMKLVDTMLEKGIAEAGAEGYPCSALRSGMAISDVWISEKVD